MSDIVIENIGPIEKSEVKILPGCITEIVGANGSGKSTALKSVRRLVGAKESLSARDGIDKGAIEYGQVRITVGATTRGGAASIDNIEGKFCLSDLVDPGLVDPVAADSRRVQALVSMLGESVSDEEFVAVFNGDEQEFNSVVSKAAMGKPDIVAKVAAVKADIETKAREHEKMSAQLSYAALSKMESISEVDMSLPSDEKELEQQYNEARDKFVSCRAVFQQQQKTSKDAEEARRRLEELSGSDLASEYTKCIELLHNARSSLDAQTLRVNELRMLLTTAESDLKSIKDTVRNLENDKCTIESRVDAHKALLAAAKATPDGDIVTQDLIDQLEQAANEAKQAMLQGAVVRKAIETREESSRLADESAKSFDKANYYRVAAKKVESILSKVMDNSGVPVQMQLVDGKPRLTVVECLESVEFIRTDKGSPTYFSDLSNGQRWQLAIRMAVAMLKGRPSSECVLVIDQDGWQDLDGNAKRKIQKMIASTNVSIVTARCSQDGESSELHTNVL